jgi:hypothetical protein
MCIFIISLNSIKELIALAYKHPTYLAIFRYVSLQVASIYERNKSVYLYIFYFF